MQPATLEEYKTFIVNLEKLEPAEKVQLLRYYMRTDLFFLLWFGCGRKDIAYPWLLERCKEVQENPDGNLDLWSRGHYKSTIITFGKTIQDVLASHGDNPLPHWKGLEPTFGIFSCTRPIAKGFLRQIKRELEQNILLKSLFPDILWEDPKKESPKWSEDDGLIVKRKSNPKESTIEAHGLVDGQPTSRHFKVQIYDDVVTIENVRSPEMIFKTTESWELSLNLGSRDTIRRYIGTRYHMNDTYREIINRQAATPRIYTATKNGEVDGEPVLLSRAELEEKRRMMGPYIFAAQMMQNPLADESQGFKKEWINFHEGSIGEGQNIYILVDPANEKKRTSDYTVIAVIGLGPDENYYLLDLVRDRMNLKERIDEVFRLHRKWRPMTVGYEKYGMQADISYMREKMGRESYHFHIVELGGQTKKTDRIKALIPVFEQGRMYLPSSVYKTGHDGKTIDLIDAFINEEYMSFPVPVHDDMLDAMSRIVDPDLQAIFPRIYEKPERYSRRKIHQGSAWSA